MYSVAARYLLSFILICSPPLLLAVSKPSAPNYLNAIKVSESVVHQASPVIEESDGDNCELTVVSPGAELNNDLINMIQGSSYSCDGSPETVELKLLTKDATFDVGSVDGFQKDQGFYLVSDDIYQIYAYTIEGLTNGTIQLHRARKGRGTITEDVFHMPEYEWRGVQLNLAYISCTEKMLREKVQTWRNCMKSLILDLALKKINKIGVYARSFYDVESDELAHLDFIRDYALTLGVDFYPILDTKLTGIPENLLPELALEGMSSRTNLSYNIDRVEQPFRADLGKLELVDRIDFAREGRKYSGDLDLKGYAKIFQSGWEDFAIPEENKVFELGVNLKSSSVKGQVAIYVEQYDSLGRVITGYTFTPRVILSDQFRVNWIPVFRAPSSHSFSVKIKPVERYAEQMIYVDGLQLLASDHLLVNVLPDPNGFRLISQETAEELEFGVDYSIKLPLLSEYDRFFDVEMPLAELELSDRAIALHGNSYSFEFNRVPLRYRTIPLTKFRLASIDSFRFYQEIFDRLSDYKFIHMSFDEHKGGLNRDSRSLNKGLSNAESMARIISAMESLLTTSEEVCEFDECVIGVNSSAKLLAWDDMINKYHNGGKADYLVDSGGEFGASSIDKAEASSRPTSDFLPITWWYRAKDEREVIAKSVVYYSALNYKLVAAVWKDPSVVRDWMCFYGGDEIRGVIASSWDTDGPVLADLVGRYGWSGMSVSQC